MRDGFLWGVATSAFQLEGSPHADWTSWDEILSTNPDVTGHYRRYRDDLLLLRDLGVNAYRFSMEWSRIQPREGSWDLDALRHYQEVIDILRENGIEPMVTIHHFTHPLWFIKRYPWHIDLSVDMFTRYVEGLVSRIKGVRYWITFNEPYVLLLGGYLEGCMPPGIRDADACIRALLNILKAHRSAYDLLHGNDASSLVSVAHNMAALAPWRRWNPLDRSLSRIAKRFYNHSLLDAFLTGRLVVTLPFMKKKVFDVPVKGSLDFFGVNYYTRVHIRFNPFRPLGVEIRHRDIDGQGLTDMGWEIYPEGLAKVLRYASRLGVPLIITENGIATRSARRKMAFMKRHVDVMEQCIRQAMDIRGYFYWSLIDNYEWLSGTDARFGLYRVDFTTLARTPTQAAKYYSYLIKSRNGSHHDTLPPLTET